MATDPNLNILDTRDNQTLIQLQQAQQLAVGSNNAVLAAQLGNAIQTLLLTSNIGGGFTPETGNPGGGVPGNGGPSTGGGTPTGGRTPQVGTNPILPGLVTISPVTGGGVGTPQVGTNPILPGTVTITPVTGGGTIGPGGPQGPTNIPDLTTCINPTYRIGSIKEVKTNIPQSIIPPYSDFAQLASTAKQCILIAEVFKCCPTGETFIGWIQIAEAQISKYYEDCPGGGKKAILKQYYDVDNFALGSFVVKSSADFVDGTGNLKTFPINDPRLASSAETLKVYDGKWSDSCGGTNFSINPNQPNQSRTVYTTFLEYLKSKYLSGLTIGNESRQIQTGIRIFDSINLVTSGGVNTISSAVKASCEAEGDCVKTDGGGPGDGGPGDTCVDTWNIGTSFDDGIFDTVTIPIGYTLNSETGLQQVGDVETITFGLETIPNNPCYKGTRQILRTTFRNVKTYVYRCDKNNVFTKIVSVTRISDSAPIYVNPVFDESKRNLQQCKCEEIYVDAGVILDPKDPCGCKQYNIVKVRVKCPGSSEFTDSTEVYKDGIPPGLNIPIGHKLDPYIPFSLRGDCQEESIKIYHSLMLGKDIVEGKVTSNTRGLFNLSQSINCYLTSSSQTTSSKEYYYEVTDCDCHSTPYFAVAYGNKNGSGSMWASGETNDTSTRAIYSQYRLLALEEPERTFKFYNSGTEIESNDIYVINFYRNALSDRIDPGNFEVALRPLNGDTYPNNTYTGSNVQPSGSTVYTFIDNSGDKSEDSSCTNDPYLSYDIVSGSLDYGIHSSGTGANLTTYGKFYPNLGVMVFDPTKLNTLLKFNTVTGSNLSGDNAFKLYTSISGSGVLGSHMKARNVKYKTTNHYFVRVSPPNANYSNNPTFVSSSVNPAEQGKLLNSCFQKEPVTYVTSVGLYNDKRELLAIAKLSKPIKKTSDDDLLIKIRLNW